MFINWYKYSYLIIIKQTVGGYFDCRDTKLTSLNIIGEVTGEI